MNTQILIQYGVELIVLIIAGFILFKIQSKKPKLVSYLTNISFFELPGPPPFSVGTHTIIIQNNGRGKAEEIEVGHSQLPFVKVIPDIQFRIEDTPQGGKIIKFPNLLHKQKINISYLYTHTSNPTVYLPTFVKSKEVDAKVIQTFLSPIYPKWIQYVAGISMLLGLVFLINLIVELVKNII